MAGVSGGHTRDGGMRHAAGISFLVTPFFPKFSCPTQSGPTHGLAFSFMLRSAGNNAALNG